MDLSIIIPSFNEGQNVVAITERIRNVLLSSSKTYEIWFIDDSKDDTPVLLEELSNKFANVHYIHRKTSRGLGSAVVQGFAAAKGNNLIVMDADLQHPPEILPDMIASLENNDLVIPSRFVPGGSDGGLNQFRKLVSWVARKIGQFALKRFREISDCTSGLFGLRREVIQGVNLNPSSWKILMEVLVKGQYRSVAEVPYEFQARNLGDSKMSMKEQVNYLWHVMKLVANSPEDRRFYLFCAVGALGVFVNLLFFHLYLAINLHALTASVLASLTAMIHNFMWHHHVTWKDCRPAALKKKFLQFPQFAMVSIFGIMITALTVKGFLLMNWHASIGQLVGVMLATSWNYIINKRWTWKVAV